MSHNSASLIQSGVKIISELVIAGGSLWCDRYDGIDYYAKYILHAYCKKYKNELIIF